MSTPDHAGSLFVVAAPSGAGKTSLVAAMLSERPGVELSVSATTRPPRPGEREGVDYFFIGAAEFERRREAGEFLEWALVHGNCYGTSRAWIESRMAAGADIVLEIDWQGAAQVKRLFPDAIGVFIAPPSIEELRARLQRRGQDAADVIERRVAAAKGYVVGGGQVGIAMTAEDVQDLMSSALAHAGHTGCTVAYDDAGNRFVITVNGGGATGAPIYRKLTVTANGLTGAVLLVGHGSAGDLAQATATAAADGGTVTVAGLPVQFRPDQRHRQHPSGLQHCNGI